MPRKDHTEEQIVGVLRQVEAAARVAEIYRKVGDQPGDVLSVEAAVVSSRSERAA